MSLRALHKNRGVGAVIALIGMAFYAMLFPWHTVSQTSLLLAEAGADTTTIPSCHREATGEPAKAGPPRKQGLGAPPARPGRAGKRRPASKAGPCRAAARSNKPPGLSSFTASARRQVFARHR